MSAKVRWILQQHKPNRKAFFFYLINAYLLIAHTFSHSSSQTFIQSFVQSVSQSVSQSVIQSIRCSPIHHQSISPTVNYSINHQAISQSASPSVSQSFKLDVPFLQAIPPQSPPQ